MDKKKIKKNLTSIGQGIFHFERVGRIDRELIPVFLDFDFGKQEVFRKQVILF
tara:strand:- start:202 stop:360 length:159 start_codon:yes stop_codon:yes gene_type:complete